MKTIKLLIGLTKSDRFNNYIPMCDGWREGAEQSVIELDYPDYMETVWDVAERVFIATNAPEEAIAQVQSQQELYDMLAALNSPVLRALSVGDTVEYDGIRLACERTGWRRIPTSTEESFGLGAALAAEADVTTERA